MTNASRRAFLHAAGGSAALIASESSGQTVEAAPGGGGPYRRLKSEILELLQTISITKAFKIWAPATKSGREFVVEFNGSEQLLVGSVIKSYILCERMRQLDSPNIVQTLIQKQITLDASSWSPTSPVFNPPHVTGLVSERTAMEAMIMHSDNTGTDMVLALAGPDNVRHFLTLAGLNNSMIPDSTRAFIGYMLAAPNYKTFTWNDYISYPDDAPLVNPPLNSVETLSASADDLVWFYSRALQGAFFKHQETLTEFRRILSLGEDISAVPFPLGASAFAKGGNVDLPGYHAGAVAGGLFFSGRWAYFAFTLNWNAPSLADPETLSAGVAVLKQILALVKERLSAG